MKLTLKQKRNRCVDIRHPTIGWRRLTVKFDKEGKNPVVRDVTDVDSIRYSQIKDVIKILSEAAADLDDPWLEIEPEHDYGSTTVNCSVFGNRPATAEEVEAAEKQLLRDLEIQEQMKATRIEMAKELLRQEEPGVLREEEW